MGPMGPMGRRHAGGPSAPGGPSRRPSHLEFRVKSCSDLPLITRSSRARVKCGNLQHSVPFLLCRTCEIKNTCSKLQSKCRFMEFEPTSSETNPISLEARFRCDGVNKGSKMGEKRGAQIEEAEIR